MNNKVISNETRIESLNLQLDNVKTKPTISSVQEYFLLCEADFLRLKNGKSSGVNIAITFFLTSIGFGVSFLSKYIVSIVNQASLVYETWEWVAPLVAGAISLVIFLVFKVLPNDYTKVMNEIEQHFKKAPRKRRVDEVEDNVR